MMSDPCRTSELHLGAAAGVRECAWARDRWSRWARLWREKVRGSCGVGALAPSCACLSSHPSSLDVQYLRSSRKSKFGLRDGLGVVSLRICYSWSRSGDDAALIDI
jgi:hypothetical protein